MATWFVYITAKEKTQALAIGRALVEERLAACINVLDGMTSVYRWEGAVEEASEAVLIAKTTEPLLPALIVAREGARTRIRVPASWRGRSGPEIAPYLDWIERETG